MASISRDPNGNKRILFTAPDGERKAIRLGPINMNAAGKIKEKIEALVADATAGKSWDRETARWVGEREAVLYDKLAAVGLVPKRAEAERTTLDAWLDSYIKGRPDVKGSTAIVYGHTRRCLVKYFGAGKPLAEIAPGDVDAFRIWLAHDERLAENTVRRRLSIAKQFFRAAQRKKLLAENPFADLKGIGVQSNRSRDHFVTQADTQKLIDAAPDAEWRAIIALARFAGLRTPSETLALRWADVDWPAGRLTVRSPKTEHHAEQGVRVIPLFASLRPHLEALWEPGAEFVINRYRDASQNLRTTFEKIIERAGLTPWPKAFQNMRASRATELAAEYPAHVAAAWLGHSTLVAQKHYWQVTDADFQQAIAAPKTAPAEAAQIQARPVAESVETVGQPESPTPSFSRPLPLVLNCTPVQVGPVGLEPTTKGL